MTTMELRRRHARTTGIEIRRARATFEPSTLNRDARTVEAVIATDSPVPMPGRIERLSIVPEAVALPTRMPLIDAHNQGSIGNILGYADNFRFDAGGRLWAMLHIRDDHAFELVADGILTGVSIGYRVQKFTDRREAGTGQLVRTVTRFAIVECSLVVVPADENALIRSKTMEDDEVIEPGTETISENPGNETRAEVNAQIRSIAQSVGLGDDFANRMIDEGRDLLHTRAAAFDAMQRRNVNISTVRVGPSGDDPAVVHERMAEALACRATGTAPSDAARPYMNMGFADMARLSLQRAGVPGVNMMGREELVTRAMHVTSDFANLTTATGNRILMPAYTAAESPLKRLARQRTADDFRPMSLLKLGEFGKLAKVTEAGEVKALTTGESVEGYSLDTFGGLFNLSRKAIINDDLGAFARWAEMMGRAAAETEADQLVALLTGNPVLSDGVALFHASHGNLAASGDVPDVDTLSAARLALRRQTGLDGVSPISATPKFVLAPPELETTFEKLLAELAAAKVDDQNPFTGKLTLLVEPRLTDAAAWYVFADPAILPVLEYAYLSSASGPQLASRDGWETLGREFRVVLDFGAGAVDHRGAYRNPGDSL